MIKTTGHWLILNGSEDISAQLTWLRLRPDGEPDGPRGDIAPAVLNQLAVRFAEDAVCLLVPMSAVTVHGPRLPGRHDAAALRGLGWLLEENVASAVSELTLVPLGSEGEIVWTAAIDRTWLTNWQALFAQAGMRLARIVPDALAIPLHDAAPTALKWGDRWLLRTAQWQAVAVEQDWLVLWHAAWQRDNSDAPPFYYYGDAGTTPPGWRPLATPDALVLLGRAAVNTGMSLLPQQPTARRWRAGYPTAIAAAAALGLLLLYQGVVYWQGARQTAELAQQVQQQFAQRFPDMARSDNWQAAARRAVRPASADGLAQWLERLPSLPDGVVVSGMTYRADKPALQLTLSGSASARAGVQRLLEKEFTVIVEPDGALRLTQREAAQ